MPQITALQPAGLMPPAAAYSHGVAAGPFVFVAGQAAIGANGELVGPGDVAEQTRQCLRNVSSVLAAEGLDLGDVASTTVYLADFGRYVEYDAAYAAMFGTHRPARATVRAELVWDQLLVEIQAVAVRREER